MLTDEELEAAKAEMEELFEDPERALDIVTHLLLDTASLLCLFLGMLEKQDKELARNRAKHLANLSHALGESLEKIGTKDG